MKNTTKKENKKQATANANTQATATENGATVITADNLKSLGERIALKALKTVYAKSGHDFILKLYNGLVADIKDETRKTLSDGYDIASVAQTYLLAHMGKSLNDTTDEKDKDGNPATVLRSCFRAVNRYIMSERQRVYKCVYVDEYEENGDRVYHEVPKAWDIDSISDYKTITAIITALKLSPNEKRFLTYRLRGKSLNDIAKLMNIKRDTLNSYAKRIKEKAKKNDTLTPLMNKLKNN